MNSFELGPNEIMIAIFRKHPFYLWVSLIKYIIIAILGFVVLSYSGAGDGYGNTLFIVLLIALWVAFFVEWTNFMLDTWILTNQRLIDVDQIALFSRRVSTLSLDRIQDITVEEAGFLDTFLGLGTVFIQTAGEVSEFKIPGAKDPVHVKDLIMQAYQTGKQELFQQIHELS